jgi:chromosome segregation ATPase
MTPDSVESRLGRLEQSTAQVHQRVEDLDRDVRTFAPMVVSLVRVEESVKGLVEDTKACRQSVAEVRKTIAEDRDERAQLEREREKAERDRAQSMKVALVGLTGAIVAAIITTIGALLVAGVF